jgi:hypothetical protein
MSEHRESIDALVCEYLAGGGRIRKIPGAISATPDEVLRYLKAQKVDITVARAKHANAETKYLHGVEVINSKDLVQLANVHRRKQRLPPFELT